MGPVRDAFLKVANSLTAATGLTPAVPIVLLYHGIPMTIYPRNNAMDAETFEEHIVFMKQAFEIVSVHDFPKKQHRPKKIRVILTFDDGFRNNATVVGPILKKHGIPAVFFVSSRHTSPGKYLWFKHLEALEYSFRWNSFEVDGRFMDMTSSRRTVTLADLRTQLLSLRPHPQEMYRVIDEKLPPITDLLTPQQIENSFAGMTEDQVAWIGNQELFVLGGHTVDHPILTLCSIEEQERQVQENRIFLEKVSGKACHRIAYPAGSYDSSTLDLCNNLGLTTGFAVLPKGFGLPNLEVPRIGIYSASRDVLEFKLRWGIYLRKMRVKVG